MVRWEDEEDGEDGVGRKLKCLNNSGVIQFPVFSANKNFYQKMTGKIIMLSFQCSKTKFSRKKIAFSFCIVAAAAAAAAAAVAVTITNYNYVEKKKVKSPIMISMSYHVKEEEKHSKSRQKKG
uniref:Transmembrane protein n=1 Tax=Glossina pallidipes TaxID=7398 RepID=A0A1B0AIC5_GLOPL